MPLQKHWKLFVYTCFGGCATGVSASKACIRLWEENPVDVKIACLPAAIIPWKLKEMLKSSDKRLLIDACGLKCGAKLFEREGMPVKGMAHITGGGLIDNVARILPSGVAAVFRSDAWQVPPVFKLIQEQGGVGRDEMYHVFNMGIGMVIVCPPARVDDVIAYIPEARLIGEVVRGDGKGRVVIS